MVFFITVGIFSLERFRYTVLTPCTLTWQLFNSNLPSNHYVPSKSDHLIEFTFLWCIHIFGTCGDSAHARTHTHTCVWQGREETLPSNGWISYLTAAVILHTPAHIRTHVYDKDVKRHYRLMDGLAIWLPFLHEITVPDLPDHLSAADEAWYWPKCILCHTDLVQYLLFFF